MVKLTRDLPDDQCRQNGINYPKQRGEHFEVDRINVKEEAQQPVHFQERWYTTLK